MNRFNLSVLYFVLSVTIARGAQHRFEESGAALPPGSYVYDPLHRVSETNTRALQVPGECLGDRLRPATRHSAFA